MHRSGDEWPMLCVRVSWLSALDCAYIGVWASDDASYIIARARLLGGRRVRTHWGIFVGRPLYEWDAQGLIADLATSMRRIGAPVGELPAEARKWFGVSADEFADRAS